MKHKARAKRAQRSKVRARAKRAQGSKVLPLQRKRPEKIAKRSTRAKRERRLSRRLAPKNLWMAEIHGDYRFTSEVRDISQTGIFLKKRVLSPGTETKFLLPSADQPIQAIVVRDDLSKDSLGTAYRFSGLTKDQSRALKDLLRRL